MRHPSGALTSYDVWQAEQGKDEQRESDLVEDEVLEVDAELLDFQVELLRGRLDPVGGEVGCEAGVGRDADEVH